MLGTPKRIIAYSLIIVAILVALAVHHYLQSFQYVTVTYRAPIESVSIEPQETDPDADTAPTPTTLKSGEKVRLKKGDYILTSHGAKVAQNPTKITLGNTPATKTLDYVYSDDYLATLYKSEATAITKALYASNPLISKHYRLVEPHLYDKGEWFGGILKYTGTESLERDYLRFVMQKTDGSWKVVAQPKILLNKYDNKNVPFTVLSQINSLDVGQPVLDNGDTPIQTVD